MPLRVILSKSGRVEYSARITDDADWNPDDSRTAAVYSPSAGSFPGRFALDLVSLPFANLNDQTAKHILALPEAKSRAAYCAVFVLDPFTQWEAFLQLIGNAGFKGICNFPPLPRFGKEEQEALKASGFSFEKELELLEQFSSCGFEIAVMCGSDSELRQAQVRLEGLTKVFCLLPGTTVQDSPVR